MAVSSVFYNRIGAVSLWRYNMQESRAIIDAKVNGKIPGLNFRFHCETTCTCKKGIVCVADVGILGLSADTIRQWTTYDKQEKFKGKDGLWTQFVTVYAGYAADGQKSDDYRELFTIPVVGAYPTMPPEMWLNIKSFNGCLFSDLVTNNSSWILGGASPEYAALQKEESEEKYSIKDICTQMAEKFSLTLRWKVSEEVESKLPKIGQFDYSGGTAQDALATFNGMKIGVIGTYSVESSSMRVLTLSGFGGMGIQSKEIKGVTPILTITDDMNNLPLALQEPESSKDIIQIEEKSGMIGMPQFSFGQVKVKTLLRRDIGIGSYINVKSNYIPGLRYDESANPWYRVNKIEYDGEFRGQSWYSTFTAIRPGVGEA